MTISIKPQPTKQTLATADVEEASVCRAPEEERPEVAVCYGPVSEFVKSKPVFASGGPAPAPIDLTLPSFKGGTDIEQRLKEQVASGVKAIVGLPKRDENGQPTVIAAKNGDMMMGNGEVISPEGKTIATLGDAGQFMRPDPKTGKPVPVSAKEQAALQKAFDPSGKTGAKTQSMPLLSSATHLELNGYTMNAKGQILDPKGEPFATAMKDKKGHFTGQFTGPSGGPALPSDQQAALWRGMLQAKVVRHDPLSPTAKPPKTPPPSNPADHNSPLGHGTGDDSVARNRNGLVKQRG